MVTYCTENRTIRFLLFIAILIWIANLDYHELNPDFSLCLIHQLTGIHCYGCGFLRGVAACMHMDFNAAIQLNPLNIITVPLITFLSIQKLFKKEEHNNQVYANTP